MWMTKQFTNKNISSMVSDTQVFIDFIFFFLKKKTLWDSIFLKWERKIFCFFPCPSDAFCARFSVSYICPSWKMTEMTSKEISWISWNQPGYILYIMWCYFPNFVGILENCLYIENSQNWYAFLDDILKKRESFIAYCLFSHSVTLGSKCSIFWGNSPIIAMECHYHKGPRDYLF